MKKRAAVGMYGRCRKRPLRPERVMTAGFLMLSLLGSVLLAVPVCSQTGESIGWGNAVFTAASAVCVTGLVTVDVGTTFSAAGQAVLLCLIQVGGLGFMIFATLMMAALGRRITLQDRLLIQASMNASAMNGLVRLSGWYGLMALGIESAGALLLSVRFVPAMGWRTGLWYSLWHSVSAFCNAGFDLSGGFRSLTLYAADPVVLLTEAALIILGGIGFAVMADVISHRFRMKRCTLHTRLTMAMTALLLLLGTLQFALAEWTNPLTLGLVEGTLNKLNNAFFQSVTMRTAGFNTIPLAYLRDSTKMVCVLLMLTGASSASTGGGIKLTTAAVLLLAVWSGLRGEDDVNISNRRVPPALLRRALTIISMYGMLLFAGAMAISLIEGERYELIDILFEAASALATAGVSSIGTQNLHPASKAVLIPMMFAGRVGPMTMALALARQQGKHPPRLRWPEETITIG